MAIYKFRAECLNDIVLVLKWLKNSEFESAKITKVAQIKSAPDRECELGCSLEFGELKRRIKLVEDSHVMVETLAPLFEYTGERHATKFEFPFDGVEALFGEDEYER